MNIKNKVFSSNAFCFNKERKTISAEISDLQLGYGPNDNEPSVISILSEKTGQVASFNLISAIKNAEGEITGWEYFPSYFTKINQPQLKGWNLVVFND